MLLKTPDRVFMSCLSCREKARLRYHNKKKWALYKNMLHNDEKVRICTQCFLMKSKDVFGVSPYTKREYKTCQLCRDKNMLRDQENARIAAKFLKILAESDSED